jgi:hypothetical protein
VCSQLVAVGPAGEVVDALLPVATALTLIQVGSILLFVYIFAVIIIVFA